MPPSIGPPLQKATPFAKAKVKPGITTQPINISTNIDDENSAIVPFFIILFLTISNFTFLNFGVYKN